MSRSRGRERKCVRCVLDLVLGCSGMSLLCRNGAETGESRYDGLHLLLPITTFTVAVHRQPAPSSSSPEGEGIFCQGIQVMLTLF